MKGKDRKKGKKRDFYGRVLAEAEKLDFEEATDIEGLDEEITILRLKLRQLIQNEPAELDLCLKVLNTLARLVTIRYNITKDQKKSLKEAVSRVLTEIAVPLGIKILTK